MIALSLLLCMAFVAFTLWGVLVVIDGEDE